MIKVLKKNLEKLLLFIKNFRTYKENKKYLSRIVNI